MQLKYLKAISQPSAEIAKIQAVAWAPNNKKLAVCNAERVIFLFDEHGEKRDKFSTKPIDSKYGKKSYVVKGLAFSPDSTKLAVGQTDGIIFVYKIGDGWNEKKVICNKFVQQSPVTCLSWPTDRGIVFGLADGKVRTANVKTNKSSTVYGTGTFVVSIAPGPDGKSFLSGHADGSIVRCLFEADGDAHQTGKICSHTSPAYCLAWTSNSILAAGCDKRLISYSREGAVLQQFDYGREPGEREFACMATSPSGQNAVIGSYDRLRVFNWNPKRGAWEEGKVMEIQYLYAIPNISWKYDGSKIVIGTLAGGVHMFDCALKRSKLKNFEVTYVGTSQIIVKNATTDDNIVVKSNQNMDITDVKVMGRDRYVVARTAETLLLGDIGTGNTSEIMWDSAGNEKFYFENENVCMIFNAGELTLVEYGKDEIVGQVRTEFINPHLISVRINERPGNKVEDCRKLAYLLDLKTVCIVDLTSGITIATVTNDTKLDWIELNETGRKLLFRDKRNKLMLYNIETELKHALLGYCTYVQWVPKSDVVVAQNRNAIAVWYNIDTVDQVSLIPIRGDVVDLVREGGVTEVIVQEGAQEMGYPLDEGLIEFGTAIDDTDYNRAVTFLESKELTGEAAAMWKQLAKLALQHKQLHVCQRCYAALGDVPRVRFVTEMNRIAAEAAKNLGGDGTQHYKVRARLAVMNRNFKEAESIYMEQNAIEEAIQMYEDLHRYDEALALAESRSYPDLATLKSKINRHLAETGQDEEAGDLKEREGDYLGAIDYYLKANLPSRAARVISSQQSLWGNTDLIQTIAVALIKSDLFGRAGELFESVKDFERALECYRKGKSYEKAVEMARYAYPQEVKILEEEWGDYLMQQRQTMNAINHYVESGNTAKALDAAIQAEDWTRAVDMIKTFEEENPELAKDYYAKIAPYFASVQDFDNAERYYIEAGLFKEAIEMYNKFGKYEEAHRLSTQYLQQEESHELYMQQAKMLENQGKFREAEKLYMAMKQPNLAVEMYKNADQRDEMMRVIDQYFPDRAEDIHLSNARELQDAGKYRDAELHYLAAKEWKSAASMYRDLGMWEEAHRVAKQAGGDAAARQVAFHWAKSLGGDSAVKLLQKFGLLEDAIDSACENGAFEFAFELCRLGNKSRMPIVSHKYAQLLESEGQLERAEQQYVQAGRPKDAMMMHIQRQDWDGAQRIAEKHVPEEINEVYMGQAGVAFGKKEFAKGEAYLLRAKRPDIIVQTYKDLNMWQDALRVCKEYVPNMYPQIQKEFDQYNLMSGAKGAESFVAQAKQSEAQGDYLQAAHSYLKVCDQVTNDKKLMETSWIKAGELAVKFIYPSDSFSGLKIVAKTVEQLKEINCHSPAAELYIQLDMIKEAVDVLMEGQEWQKAKRVASEMEPELEPYVDELYKSFLRQMGNTDQLANLDVLEAIELLVQKGEWQKALDIAKDEKNPALSEKYVTMYANELLQANNLPMAVKVVAQYNSPTSEKNVGMYRTMFMACCERPNTDNTESFEMWAGLRDMLFSAVENSKSSDIAAPGQQELLSFLCIANWYATRSACYADKQLHTVAHKISVAVVRYSDILPPDRCFYEAGNAARDEGGAYEDLAFIMLNHYLDLVDAIEDKSPETVDYTDFQGTDVPMEIPLPDKACVPGSDHAEVKEWVLAVSVEKDSDRQLPRDSRGQYEASLRNENDSSCNACVITGYPVLNNRVAFSRSEFTANRDDWIKFSTTAKMGNNEQLQDCYTFITKWLGSAS